MQKGFTLAEVLITLGIIGVVAAMTLPSLIANYNKQVYVTQLKKSISVIEQGLKLAIANDSVDSLENTQLFQSISGTTCTASNGMNSTGCVQFLQNFKKYFQVTSIVNNSDYKFSYIRKGSTPMFPGGRSGGAMIYLSDGMSIQNWNLRKTEETPTYNCNIIKQAGGNMCRVIGNIDIDVNGKKKPNVMGRDVHQFSVTADGRLIPYYSYNWAIYVDGRANGSSYWRNRSSACGTPGQPDAISIAQYGNGCAARLIENGWEMDY